MTEKEAIIFLKSFKEDNNWGGSIPDALERAITTLEEIQQYRNIGTIEECEEAIEKQQAIEVKEVLLPNGRTGYECGYCGNELEVNMFHCEYCHWCGQKIDW